MDKAIDLMDEAAAQVWDKLRMCRMTSHLRAYLPGVGVLVRLAGTLYKWCNLLNEVGSCSAYSRTWPGPDWQQVAWGKAKSEPLVGL